MRHVGIGGALLPLVSALNNGLAITPPMGFNSYMSSVSGESGLGSIAAFFKSSGLQQNGYNYINTDEGWELKTRDPKTGELQWNPDSYPSGLPTFITQLHAMGLKYGIYGAASGVTCDTNPGQLYYEDIDAQTYAKWWVETHTLPTRACHLL
jgi:alpha-galactosidase